MKSLLKGVALSMMAGAIITSCSSSSEPAQTPMAFHELTQSEKDAGLMTAEVMLKMTRLSSSTLSPDGKTMLYALNVQNVETNSSCTNIFAKDIATNEVKQLTFGLKSSSSAQWNKDGSKIYYSKGGQVWVMNADGSAQVQVSNVEGGINGFIIAPSNDKLLYTKNVKIDKTADDYYPEYDKSGAMIYDDLMVRHWNYWVDGTYSHIFVADLLGDKLSGDKDINAGEAWDTPYAPYFPMDNITWNNAGTQIVYSSKKMTGIKYAKSTNSNLYLYDVAAGTTTDLIPEFKGYDNAPVFNADDTKLAWISMERDGNEADLERLMVMDMATKKVIDLTSYTDNDAGEIKWEGNTIYFIAPLQATHQLCRVEAVEGAKVEQLTDGIQDYTNINLAADKIYVEKTTLSSPVDVVALDRNNYAETQFTEVNKHIMDYIKMGKVEKRWVKTTDNKQMLTWVVLPPNFDENSKYPTLLYCQGGPQSVVSQRWSYRWNLQVFAADGYVIVAPNRRGLPSFGTEWNDQISGDYSGQNIKDYLSAIDDVSKEKYVDTDRLGCVGASYGGYSTYYLAGHHNKRFKAFISHCGMFNLESFYGSTEELWFPTWDLGGAYWEKNNKTAQRSYANSPHKSVDKWDTPILIIVGLNDFRIPYAESLQAFTAAKGKGLDARLLAFEDEGHQVFKPQNALIWHSEFLAWLNKHLAK